MRMVRSGNSAGVDALPKFIQHHAEVGEALGLGIFPVGTRATPRIHITERNDVCPGSGGAGDVRRAFATRANAGDGNAIIRAKNTRREKIKRKRGSRASLEDIATGVGLDKAFHAQSVGDERERVKFFSPSLIFTPPPAETAMTRWFPNFRHDTRIGLRIGSIRVERANDLQIGKGLLQFADAFFCDIFATVHRKLQKVGHGV